MKKLITLILSAAAVTSAVAQDTAFTAPNHEVNFELGKGLNYSFNEGAYQFKISGMMQPYFAVENNENADEPDYLMNSKRTYLNFSGKALEEKVSFFFQADFSLNDPLLDAWVAYQPFGNFIVTAGQKQNITNNREMLFMETNLQFPDRSLLSTSFSQTGREFGLFVENTFGGDRFAVVPQVSVTSGDGRNSFGSDSRDVDLGGVKYGARLDVYPLGLFTEGNEKLVADLAHEEKPKLVIGGAYSYNDGASNAVGEGHGDVYLYNALGEQQLPDYRQVYADILFNYKGFSLLGEYALATATSLEGSYADEAATEVIIPTQISEFLALGSAYNAQIGYVTKSGYALDLRYSQVTPEFEDNANSIITETTGYTVGFSKYFKDNALKLQVAGSSYDNELTGNTFMGEFLVQVIF
ncbi:MAG: hypothetical protein CL843_07860 [Crocinitomicaceae bacterium]|nr:hypothetical protein [Crocinitomicaceae bacterium]